MLAGRLQRCLSYIIGGAHDGQEWTRESIPPAKGTGSLEITNLRRVPDPLVITIRSFRRQSDRLFACISPEYNAAKSSHIYHLASFK